MHSNINIDIKMKVNTNKFDKQNMIDVFKPRQ